ncbi:Sec-independent protein translocase protein TatA/B/E protein [Dioscorea alata]|uniref:Sec-independent protein translocase protein TatA/B/E protein n=1 Tax=Dioscorea alata TaxID=55571 RepID=A0ACB7WTQ5_DIOAL|nr:Sec-independent protein translocase protein TatA/B/E protein [Dioscorea alata]
MASAAAPAIATVCSASSRRPTPLFSNPTIALISGNTSRFHAFGSFAQARLSSFSSWHGLKHLRISFRRDFRHKGRKEKCRGSGVYASLFGVGAPEALVIGVVALLVFGPKGLAEVARNLGNTLRAFQPTIKELQDVSREFKNTLEREIGLDEVASTVNNTNMPTSSLSSETELPTVDPNGATTQDPVEFLKKIRAEQFAASMGAQSEEVASSPEAPSEAPSPATSENVSTPLAASEVAAAAPEAIAQAPSSEKTEK